MANESLKEYICDTINSSLEQLEVLCEQDNETVAEVLFQHTSATADDVILNIAKSEEYLGDVINEIHQNQDNLVDLLLILADGDKYSVIKRIVQHE